MATKAANARRNLNGPYSDIASQQTYIKKLTNNSKDLQRVQDLVRAANGRNGGPCPSLPIANAVLAELKAMVKQYSVKICPTCKQELP